jgi:hypothetical protein
MKKIKGKFQYSLLLRGMGVLNISHSHILHSMRLNMRYDTIPCAMPITEHFSLI